VDVSELSDKLERVQANIMGQVSSFHTQVTNDINNAKAELMDHLDKETDRKIEILILGDQPEGKPARPSLYSLFNDMQNRLNEVESQLSALTSSSQVPKEIPEQPL
jgi:iron-sulfur cluster repair protein YtfE (RIC family)